MASAGPRGTKSAAEGSLGSGSSSDFAALSSNF